MDLVVEVGVGLLVGLVMGALGGGGGIIAVPALVYLLGREPAVATTTSLVIVGVTGVVSVLGHARAGRVAWADGVAFGLLGAGGALLGARLSTLVSGTVTMAFFAALLLLVAWQMWRRAGAPGPTAPGAEDDRRAPWVTWRPFHLDPARAVGVLAAATLVGVLTGFFGVGGGFAIVPALTLVLGMPMRRAVGTSLLVITINAAVGLLGRLGGRLELDLPLIAVFTAAAVLGSLVGRRVGERLDPRVLQRAFAVMLLLVAVWTGLSTALR